MKPQTTYMVVPRSKTSSTKKVESLQALRRAVSRAWKGKSAVSEIRSGRKLDT